MRIAIIVLLAVGTVWDAFTTVFGTLQIMGTETPIILAALLGAAIVTACLLNTKRIFEWKGDAAGLLLKWFWFVCIAYDLYTSWSGNLRFILAGQINPERAAVLAGLTLIISGAPVVLSLTLDDRAA